MITQETINKIFETARIEEVIADFVTLKRSGSNLKGLSPFSNEKTPSFMVSPAKQIFKDFSSGKGGNAVSFLMEHEHYTYPEALKYLARKYNIEVEETEQSSEEKQLVSERESLYLINEFANNYFQEQLWKSKEGIDIGLSYFKERGFSEETIKKFQLGYSPDAYEALSKEAKDKNYNAEFLVKTGLVKESDERLTDRFRGRVMFPILSHTGRVLGFGGRTLQKDAKIAKYLNSPESEIYHKSKTLYGLFQAKNALSKEDACLLVEGYTDVISLHQAGVNNVVASSGTSLTRDQILLIKRYTKNVVLLFDGDPAGIKASLRGIDLLLEEGLSVQVLLFPDGEDPDSYSKKVSTTELKDFIEEEKRDFLRFKSSLLLEDAGDNPLERSKAAREIVESIAVIPDALERNAYIQECAGVLKLDERILFSELAQVRKNLQQRQQREEKNKQQREARLQVVEEGQTPPDETTAPGPLQPITGTPHYEQERAICWLLLNHPNFEIELSEEEEELQEEEVDTETETVAEYILTEFMTDEIEFKNAVFKKIFDKFKEHMDKSGIAPDGGTIIRESSQDVVNCVADLITEKHEIHNWQSRKIFIPEKDAYIKNYTIQAVLRYKEKRICDLIQDIQQKMKKGVEDQEERITNIETLGKLTMLRTEINKELNRVV